ncbi:hypothetical protein ESCO_001505 [Escovopsis weberi]|uniref:Extracellular membrane protein CFEM domain-containing protein n=1 Tax=Escovopsis weberi TaxID=150374 RepID=A0A0M8N6K5_ESCWE|nr:hypothetical protein ESCO_001505 [Escovopsis weberi]
MKLNILTTAVVLALTPLASACKCVGNDYQLQWESTRTCCRTARGTFAGDDCSAHSLSKRMRQFSACCMRVWDGSLKSDCFDGV